MGAHIKLTASDGHKFGAYRVDPAGTPKGGIVVIHETLARGLSVASARIVDHPEVDQTGQYKPVSLTTVCSRDGRFLSGARKRLDAVNVRSIRNSNQIQIVRRKDFPFRVLHFQSAHGFSGTFVQNLKTFLAAGEEITFSPLTQSNDDREQLSAFLG
jgi:hypothetical protein